MIAALAEPYGELPPELEAAAVDLAKSLVASNTLPLPVERYGDIRPHLTGRHLVKGLLRASATCVLFGLPGSAKSFVGFSIALHTAAGLDWFGRRTSKGGAAYIAAEGQGGAPGRIEAWRRTHGPECADDCTFALVPAAVDLLDPTVDMAKVRAVLDQLASEWGGIGLVVIDTLAATFGGGDENGSDMAAYVSNVERLCAPYGCAKIIVAHAPLNAEAKRPRGHGSLWGAADTVLHIIGDRDSPVRRIHVLKQKDDDPGPDILFQLKQVEIGTDEDGDPVTSCIIEESELDALSSPRRRLSANEKIVVDALERALIGRGIFPPDTIPDSVLNRARTAKAVTVSEWLSEAMPALAKPDTHPDTPRRTFDRARTKLQAAETIGIWEEWAWLNF